MIIIMESLSLSLFFILSSHIKSRSKIVCSGSFLVFWRLDICGGGIGGCPAEIRATPAGPQQGNDLNGRTLAPPINVWSCGGKHKNKAEITAGQHTAVPAQGAGESAGCNMKV